ncbi:hypothetical protein A0H81_05557 [Grifola frondosa]|uniref:Uncharacterized protein n=1 Tax=Grifola frondosa TaxID=5627 RepID=A0A1C7MDY2_GRIFR|nr:hypothetical protein A0H81_05557 [Grifola frondosa]
MASYPIGNAIRHTQRDVLCRSYCISKRWNPRNLERHWYGAWDSALRHLTSGMDHMIVVPQFHLWAHVPEDYVLDGQGPPGDDDSIDELDIITHDPDEREEVDAVADGSFEDPNLSTLSMQTEAATEPMERVPDFAIIHILARRLPPDHPRFTELGVSTSLTTDRHERRRKRKLLLVQAQKDLAPQCHVLFEQYPHALSTICIAAAGQYWTYRVVYRHQAPPVDISDPDKLDMRGCYRACSDTLALDPSARRAEERAGPRVRVHALHASANLCPRHGVRQTRQEAEADAGLFAGGKSDAEQRAQDGASPLASQDISYMAYRGTGGNVCDMLGPSLKLKTRLIVRDA